MRRVDRLPSDADALPAGAQVILGNPYQRGPGGAIAPVRGLMVEAVIVAKANKYGAQRTWSELCQRMFASKAEAKHGEELRLLEMAGEILNLQYQPSWVLCADKHHKAKYTADFMYQKDGVIVVEDVKGVMTQAARVRMNWLWAKYGIEVKVVR